MSEGKPRITSMKHLLPFDKLSPADFERLCFWLVMREGYERAEHLGAAGDDQGLDIVAWREYAKWGFQCKRVRRFGPKAALAEIDKVLGLEKAEQPVGLVFLVTCDVSANTRRQARKHCGERMECHFWTGTELDEKVKQHPDIVEEFFQAHSTVQKVIQTVVSPWGLLALAVGLVLASVLAAGIFNIPVLQGLLPTPMAFSPASVDQSLIIVADFDDRSGGKYQGIDPAQYIYEHLLAQAEEDGLDVRIERLRQVVDDNTVRKTGESYNATLVVWGWYDALTITPRIERIKELSRYQIVGKRQHLSLSDPERIEFSIVTDLPSQTAYLILFALGLDEYASERYYSAVVYFSSALKTIPLEDSLADPSKGYFFRGLAYLFQGGYDSAMADFDQAIQLEPDYAVTYSNRAAIYTIKGDYDHAIDDYNQGILLNPDSAGAHRARALAYSLNGEYDQAIADLEEAIRLDPEYAEAYSLRGDTYCTIGNYEDGIADLEKAIKLAPDDSYSYLYRGLCYVHMGEYSRALADFDKTIELEPSPVAYLDRGLTYVDIGEYDKALADCNVALNLDPEYALAYYGRARVHYENGDIPQAVVDLNKVLELNNDPNAERKAESIFNQMGLTPGPLMTPESALTPVFAEDFSDPARYGWGEDIADRYEKGYENGSYAIYIKEAGGIAFSTPNLTFDDFVLQAKATQIAGPDENIYGVVFRYVDNRHMYLFVIRGDGYYADVRILGDDTGLLVDWTPSPHINRGQNSNDLMVIAQESLFSFYINNEHVADVLDLSLQEGDIGLVAGSMDEAGVLIHFDNVKVRIRE